MKSRGKIVRDTATGTGLLSIAGQQYPFELEGMWKSDVAPQVNMAVDVELDGSGRVVSLQVVPEAQLAREQAEQALRSAREKGADLSRNMAARFGVDTLVAMAALIAGWFIFNTVSVHIAASYNMGFSFWKILGVLNSPMGVMNGFSSGGASTGVYGFFAIVALVGPLLPFFLKDPRAHLAGLLPLAFIVVVCVVAYMGISDGVSQAQSAALAIGGRQAERMAAEMAASMTQEALRAISFGIGGYLAVIASLYFAGRGTIKFLSSRA